MREIILKQLRAIEEKENVKILLAVESGSRAWGFESPDSDYDVRFIYVRQARDYLKLDSQRDVIEWVLDDVLDINGWDIQKALKLLYKSNPTLLEWLNSPIIYNRSQAMDDLDQLSKDYFSPQKSFYHYLNMAKTNYREYLKGDQVKAKKYFYVLRPILAAQWVFEKKEPAPVAFEELLTADLPTNVRDSIDQLLLMKQNLPESGLVPKLSPLNEFIEEALVTLEQNAKSLVPKTVSWSKLNDYFLSLITLED